MMKSPVMETNLRGLPPPKRGKVRDIYDLGDALLIVTTDRISAYDVILPTPIPEKGEVLTEMSRFWFEWTKKMVPNHLLECPLEEVISDRAERAWLGKRPMIVKKCLPLPVEAVVRGYLTGSGWREYLKTGSTSGIPLPKRLAESCQLPQPIFAPATKAEQGEHDENISFEKVCMLISRELAEQIRNISLEIYSKAAAYALERGIIIADTKFEFGTLDGRILLIDEVLTPDSSRFWPRDQYKEGRPQPSFDKQFVRDYLDTLDWDKQAPGPELPKEIVAKTAKKYREALERLTQ